MSWRRRAIGHKQNGWWRRVALTHSCIGYMCMRLQDTVMHSEGAPPCFVAAGAWGFDFRDMRVPIPGYMRIGSGICAWACTTQAEPACARGKPRLEHECCLDANPVARPQGVACKQTGTYTHAIVRQRPHMHARTHRARTQMEEVGHFLVMEDPARVAGLLASLLG